MRQYLPRVLGVSKRSFAELKYVFKKNKVALTFRFSIRPDMKSGHSKRLRYPFVNLLSIAI